MANLAIGTVLINKENGKKSLIVDKTGETIYIWRTRTDLKGVDCSDWFRLEGRDGAVATFFLTDEVIDEKDIMAWKSAMMSFNVKMLRAKK